MGLAYTNFTFLVAVWKSLPFETIPQQVLEKHRYNSSNPRSRDATQICSAHLRHPECTVPLETQGPYLSLTQGYESEHGMGML